MVITLSHIYNTSLVYLTMAVSRHFLVKTCCLMILMLLLSASGSKTFFLHGPLNILNINNFILTAVIKNRFLKKKHTDLK